MLERRRSDYTPMLVLALVFVLGLTLRLYRLDEQSVWFDEMNTLVHDSSASLSSYLSDAHQVNPDHMPLYFVLVFGWTRFIGDDPIGLRLLSVALGSLSIPLLYLFGRQVLNAKAGLIAALCLALSPLHVYMHQSIRGNALTDFLALLSLLLTLRVAASRWPGWVLLHAIVCWIAVMTHLTCALLVMLEYAFLSYCEAARQWQPSGPLLQRVAALTSARLMAFLALLGTIALFCMAWFVTMQGNGVSWYEMPSLGQWLNDLFGDAVVYLNVDLMSTPLLLQLLDASTRSTQRLILDNALLLFFISATVWGLWRARRPGRRHQTNANTLRFTVTLLFLPVCALTVLSFVWQPVVLPRYTLFSSFALFVVVGGAVAALPWRTARALAVLTLVGLYVGQLVLLLPNQTRSDFVGVREQLVRADAENENLVALYLRPDGRGAVPNTRTILRKNLKGFKMQLFMAYSLGGAVTQNMECLANASSEPNMPKRTWLLIEHWTGFPERAALEATLRATGVSFEHWQSSNLHLYALLWPRGQDADYLFEFPCERLCPDRDTLVETLTGEDADTIKDYDVIQALEWAVPRLPLPRQEWYLHFEALRAMQLSPKAGRLIGAHLRDEFGAQQDQIFLYALSYLAENRRAEAQQHFKRLKPDYVTGIAELIPGIEAVVAGNYALAREEMRETATRFPARVRPFFQYLFGLAPVPCDSSLIPLF